MNALQAFNANALNANNTSNPFNAKYTSANNQGVQLNKRPEGRKGPFLVSSFGVPQFSGGWSPVGSLKLGSLTADVFEKSSLPVF